MVRAARGTNERTPLWFMRQAGRVLPEYRAVREGRTFTDISRDAALATEVTLQPLRRFALDAAILFADIMTPLIAIGLPIKIVDGVGPVISSPIERLSDVERIRAIDPETDVPYVLTTIRDVKRELKDEQAMIGFAGAPFTLASYLIEGKSSRSFLRTKALMYGNGECWHALMDTLTEITIAYLRAQQRAGADILQLFDSWVGTLSPQNYREFVQPYSRRIFAALLETGAPLIHFGTGTATLLADMSTDGADVIGVDWRTPLDDAWRIIGHKHAIQGNLDPAVLIAPADAIRREVDDIFRRVAGRPGHIFNLGHGFHPETPLASIERVVEYVHAAGATTIHA